VSSSTDYEERGYDANGNVTSRRLRDGQVVQHGYDALNRVTLKDLPGADPDVSYAYDLLGRMTGASQPGHALTFAYDALGRQLTQTGPHGTMTSTYDAAGRRSKLIYPDGNYIEFIYLVTGETTWVSENGSGGGGAVPAIYAYDDLGRRTSVLRGSGTKAIYSYDAASRLSQDRRLPHERGHCERCPTHVVSTRFPRWRGVDKEGATAVSTEVDMAREGEAKANGMDREMTAHTTDYSKFIGMMKWGAILSFILTMIVVFIIA
jgi:YD repeat-containing protein